MPAPILLALFWAAAATAPASTEVEAGGGAGTGAGTDACAAGFVGGCIEEDSELCAEGNAEADVERESVG